MCLVIVFLDTLNLFAISVFVFFSRSFINVFALGNPVMRFSFVEQLMHFFAFLLMSFLHLVHFALFFHAVFLPAYVLV